MIAIAGAVFAGATAAAAAALALVSSRYERPEGDACDDVPAAASLSHECAVCLSELMTGAAVRTLPGCRHGFHEECIGRWLTLRADCPLCRRPVPAEVAADGRAGTTAVAPPPHVQTVPAAWSRPARIACGFGDGRVVWTRSPSL